MSSVIKVVNSGVKDAIEYLWLSQSLYLTGIILPVWDVVDTECEDMEYLQSAMDIRIKSYKMYGRPIFIDDYRIIGPEGYSVKPTLSVIRCEKSGIVPYNIFNVAATGLFDYGCDVLYITCDMIGDNVIEALVPTLGRLCRWASSKFEGVYISCRNPRVCKKLRDYTISKDCDVMLV